MKLQLSSMTGKWLFALAFAGSLLMADLASAQAQTAIRATDFLKSIGACSAVSRRGETLLDTVKAAKYMGLGWIRAGYESDIPVDDLIQVHRQTGVRFSYGLMSGGTDLRRLLDGARKLAADDALVALEGPNEPNNWGITYRGEAGGGRKSWMPVARLQRDLYQSVKNDPALKPYPVWSISEGGAETDNVGLQFLTIPPGAGTQMPIGTKFADFANVHNYIYHPNSAGLQDNKTWNAADPSAACKVDGLFGEYGRTWAGHFSGYSEDELVTLPKVTTETGTTIGGAVTEEIHALNLLTMYLDQFKRGWSHTAVYLLRDRPDEGGNQQFGFYKLDYSPRKAAVYLHRLTKILADKGELKTPGKLGYRIPNPPATVHDMLLQKSDGAFYLVVWNERIKGSDNVTIEFDKTHAVEIYDPTVGTAPEVGGRSMSLTLTLSDHPLIVEIPPAVGR